MRRLRGFLDRTRVLAALLAAIAAVSVAGAYWAALAQHGPEPSASVMELKPVLRVYKNGKLVYEKIGDPPLENFGKVLAAILTDQQQTLIATGGSGYTLGHGQSADALVGKADGTGTPSQPPVILVGTITGSVTYNTYKLDTVASSAQVQTDYIGWNSNNTVFIIRVKAALTFSGNYSINAIGLEIRPAIDGGTRPILVFADKLPNPINVTNTDSLSVVYEIDIEWPQGG
ncbi:MAG: hypothetical protein GSR80_000044 [Desulfurococcales archaeon]|nr:hypothetical protein [Desulfurococcales archaeon]